MKKSFASLSLFLLVTVIVLLGCDLNLSDDESMIFFYTDTVVRGGGVTDRTLDYDSEGITIIMTRWWESTRYVEGNLSKREAEALQDKTKFALGITGEDELLIKSGAMYVKWFHSGYEVAQDFTFDLPVGIYTLVGETFEMDGDTRKDPALYTDTVNLTIVK